VISIDARKKELIGDFYRDGVIDARGTIAVNDRDSGGAGAGAGIPHGIGGVGQDRGFAHLNTGHDTSELACDSTAAWREDHGRSAYPEAKNPLALCDGGGSTSAPRYAFKEQLQKLANRLGVEIRIARYSPYCSKYNPTEHRLFPRVSRGAPSNGGGGPVLHVHERGSHGLGGEGAHPREAPQDGPEVRRGIQKDQDDRLRQSSAQVELPGYSQTSMKSGSYSRPIA
jgi:hypothetical protein